MKRFFILSVILIALQNPGHAVQLGSYNPELEDGLFDRIKFNFFQKDKKFIEIVEPETDADKQKLKEKFEETEYDRYKYMYTPQVTF